MGGGDDPKDPGGEGSPEREPSRVQPSRHHIDARQDARAVTNSEVRARIPSGVAVPLDADSQGSRGRPTQDALGKGGKNGSASVGESSDAGSKRSGATTLGPAGRPPGVPEPMSAPRTNTGAQQGLWGTDFTRVRGRTPSGQAATHTTRSSVPPVPPEPVGGGGVRLPGSKAEASDVREQQRRQAARSAAERYQAARQQVERNRAVHDQTGRGPHSDGRLPVAPTERGGTAPDAGRQAQAPERATPAATPVQSSDGVRRHASIGALLGLSSGASTKPSPASPVPVPATEAADSAGLPAAQESSGPLGAGSGLLAAGSIGVEGSLGDDEDGGDWGLDDLFTQLESGGVPAGVEEGDAVDGDASAQANAELFLDMVAHHARPLREFVLALSMGPATRDWLEIVRPVVLNLAKGAEALDQRDLEKTLLRFDGVLARALATPGQKIAGAVREALLEAYLPLSDAMPEAFDVQEERQQREPLLVHHLLRQVPGVHKITIDKLYAAGLGSLDALCDSSADDLVAVGRLDSTRAQGIVKRFKDYRTQHAVAPTEQEEPHGLARQQLKVLLADLTVVQHSFLEAEVAEDRAAKRNARARRHELGLEIAVVLVQMGEVDLVEVLERSSTERKLEELRRYLATSQGASTGWS